LTFKNQNIDQLISACKKQNQLAQMEVYNRYCNAMYGTAIQILKNADDAEDAMQEGFITAFEKIDQYKGGHNFGGWLKRIVVRKSLHYYYHNRRMVHPDDMENMQMEASESITDSTESDSFRLKKALHKIKEKYRLILQMYYLEGFDYEEIGDIMGMSYANCRTTMTRAKAQLKKHL